MREKQRDTTREDIPLSSIKVDSDLCQHRDLEADAYRSETIRADLDDHVEKLIEGLERTGQLTPMLVWPIPEEAGRYLLLDGHHRMFAYSRVYSNKSTSVQCEVLHNHTMGEAIEYSFSQNSLDKANIPKEEKFEHTWKMLWRFWSEYEPKGAKKLERIFPTKHSTIDKMKNKIKELTTGTQGAELFEILNDPKAKPPLWREVRNRRQGATAEDMELIKKGAEIQAYQSLLGAFRKTATLLAKHELEALINQALEHTTPHKVLLMPRQLKTTEDMKDWLTELGEEEF